MAFKVAHLLRRSPTCRRVNDTAEPVKRARAQLLDGEVDVTAADVLMEERSAARELCRVEITLKRANDRPRLEDQRFDAGEALLGLHPKGSGAGRDDAGCGCRAKEAKGFASGVLMSLALLDRHGSSVGSSSRPS